MVDSGYLNNQGEVALSVLTPAIGTIFVTTALARSHYCNHVMFPNVS